MLKKFKDLSEKEILAIAIAAEEEDGRIYGEFADALRDEYPSTAQMFEEMRQEEVGHRDRLFAMFRQRFGDHIPLIRRENVKGFLRRNPTWLVRPFGVNKVRRQAEIMEMEAGRFYAKAIRRITDAPTMRSLKFILQDEFDDWREGEMLLQSLIETPEEVERAANRERELEQLMVAAGGIAGPGSIGTSMDTDAEASEGVAVG